MSQTNLQSEIVDIDKNDVQIFTFLTNLNNFEKLMPEEVSQWQSTETECSFTLKGMPSIGFTIIEKMPYSTIKYKGTGKIPPIFLSVKIQKTAETSCKVQLFLEADLNPMLKMMVEKPLTKFLNVLASNLNKISTHIV